VAPGLAKAARAKATQKQQEYRNSFWNFHLLLHVFNNRNYMSQKPVQGLLPRQSVSVKFASS
jgi:hypothetical protein